MAKRKVSKRTKKFVEEKNYKGNDPLTDNWKGRLYITDPEMSQVAKQIGIKEKGEYAIKVN